MRTIQSPGVQINEIDLSLTNAALDTTTIFIPGFAAKGPIQEPIQVSSLSEYEQIFGTPTNAAERYFYFSTKAAFQSPANIIVARLPYGTDSGVGYSSDYSALVYPAVTYNGSVSGTNLSGANLKYFFGKPTHLKLSQNDYNNILRGTAFAWSNTAGTSFASAADLAGAGLIVLNKAQTTINNLFEGFYVGIIDNTNNNPATDFNGINYVNSINNTNTAITTYTSIPSTRLNFTLSAAKIGGSSGTVSEVLENTASFDISTAAYNDVATIGVFKIRQSVFSTDTIVLDYVFDESYVASFDAHRQINSQNGGPATSFFVEDLDSTSKDVVVLVNPYISNKNGSTWLDLSGNPTKSVRFLTPQLASPLASETAGEYTTRVGAPSGMVAALLALYGSTDALFALGNYSDENTQTKVIGNVPSKINTTLARMENFDVYPLSLTVEAGLGTIYANSMQASTSGYFDDTVALTSLETLSSSSFTDSAGIRANVMAVQNEFINFAQSTRKDHMTILDPLINIVVQNGFKTLDDTSKDFTTSIYWPLRNTTQLINTSYAAMFPTAVKVTDVNSTQQVWVPFSGFAAASMGKTDSNFQPWYAPAGFTRGVIVGANDIAYYPNQKQRDQLYKISLNPVANFPNEGIVIYGQKTMQKKPSAFDRINVRRLFLVLETATRNTVKYYTFEPNTLFTRTQVVNVLDPIFSNAKNTQGMYDYMIICDERNNTPAVIDQNELVTDIYIKPTRASEFILVNFYATRTSQNFSEIVS